MTYTLPVIASALGQPADDPVEVLEPPSACEVKTFVNGPGGTLTTSGSGQANAAYTAATSSRTYDLLTTTLESGFHADPYIFNVTASNSCIYGPRMIEAHDSFRPLTWQDMKTQNDPFSANGAAFRVQGANNTFYKPRADNCVVDMFRLINNTSSTTIIGAYGTYIRDDAISCSHADMVIQDSYFECYTGFSNQNAGGGTATPHSLLMERCVFYCKPMPLESAEASEWMIDGMGNGAFFKLDGFKGTPSTWTIRDCVFYAEMKGRDGVDDWPNATFENCVVVWNDPFDVDPTYFPIDGAATPPTGVTETSDINVFTNAKNALLARITGTPSEAFGTNTLRSIQGVLEQRGASQANTLLGGPVTACWQCHPAQTGRGAWQSSITGFITDWLANPWLPRLSFLSTLLMDTETHTQCLAGAYDAQYQWLADQIKNRVFTKIGTTHPLTGKTLRGIDLMQLDWVHEANIAGTNATCLAPASRPDGTPANLAKCARRMVDVMRARQPSFNTPTNRPVMCWCPAQSGDGAAATAMIQSYPGDDYVDLIAMDVYAGGFSNPDGGSFDNPLHHAQSWTRTNTGFTLSLQGFMAPFCAATPSNFAVQACNSTAHLGEADLHGGRTVAKPMGFIEVGTIAIDRSPTGGDGVIDGGTGDNPLFINNFANWLEAELQKPLAGDQITHGERVLFMNYFDINVKANRTSHRLSNDTSTDRFVYDFPNAAAAYANRFV